MIDERDKLMHFMDGRKVGKIGEWYLWYHPGHPDHGFQLTDNQIVYVTGKIFDEDDDFNIEDVCYRGNIW